MDEYDEQEQDPRTRLLRHHAQMRLAVDGPFNSHDADELAAALATVGAPTAARVLGRDGRVTWLWLAVNFDVAPLDCCPLAGLHPECPAWPLRPETAFVRWLTPHLHEAFSMLGAAAVVQAQVVTQLPEGEGLGTASDPGDIWDLAR